MREALFSLIGISLLQCVLLMIIQDESTGKVIKLIGGAAMAAILISGVKDFDYQTYASALQQKQAETYWDAEAVKNDVALLNRRYIESKCSAYILERASQMQIELLSAEVTLAWNTDGFWYPVHAEMTVTEENTELYMLKRLIESELGIPIAEQIWRAENESD